MTMTNDLVVRGHKGELSAPSSQHSGLAQNYRSRSGSRTQTILWEEEAKRMAILDHANINRQAAEVRLGRIAAEHDVFLAEAAEKLTGALKSKDKAELLTELTLRKHAVIRQAMADLQTNLDEVNRNLAYYDKLITACK